MVYNFNLGIGWASSGVEFAQKYRSMAFERIGVDAKFIYTDFFPQDNIEHLTANMGFKDEQIIWLYTFFTDQKIEPCSYSLQQLLESIPDTDYTLSRNGKSCQIKFGDGNDFYTVYMVDETTDLVHRVEMVRRGFLIRKDYFTSCRVFSEYYAPLDGKAHLYERRFFNRDGSVAYEEVIDDEDAMYKLPGAVPCSKEGLVAQMVRAMDIKPEDTVIIDRTTGIGASILHNLNGPRVGIVIHADHFSENNTDEDYILWNNYYEFAFSQHKFIDFYITATEAQNRLFTQQMQDYVGVTPQVYSIPVGNLTELKRTTSPRRAHSMVTASRLAPEKHLDWLVRACVKAHEQVPDISLDICGKGGAEKDLKKLIADNEAEGYIRLLGQQNMEELYLNYEVYASASTSEGFGLTLMEAVGSGLPIIGFDVRYGNPTFIRHEENGYLIPLEDEMEIEDKIDALAQAMIRIFTQADMASFEATAYDVAANFLYTEVDKKWQQLLA